MTDRLPWFPLYVSDWLLDLTVQQMTLEQQGAYLKLLCLSWHNDGIPADAPAIAALLGGRADLWSAPLTDCWVTHPARADRLINPRLEAVRGDQDTVREQRSHAGRAGRLTQLGQTPGKRRANAGQTPGDRRANAGQTPGKTGLTEQSRTEQNKTEEAASISADAPDSDPLPLSADYLTACVQALNAGLGDNRNLPSYRQVSAGEQAGTVSWEAEGIPLAVATATIRKVAGKYRPTPRNRQPSSLRYFDAAVREAHTGERKPGAGAVSPPYHAKYRDPYAPPRGEAALGDMLGRVMGQIGPSAGAA